MSKNQPEPIQIFYCYAPEDIKLLVYFEKHLSPLKHSKRIVTWKVYEINAGLDWIKELDAHLKNAEIVLLLISPDFIASELCSVAMQGALERQLAGECVVIPILLRPVFLEETPISKLQALPKNDKPVTLWRNRDAAFFCVVVELWNIVRNLTAKKLGIDIEKIYHADSLQISGRDLLKELGIDVDLIADAQAEMDRIQHQPEKNSQDLQIEPQDSSMLEKPFHTGVLLYEMKYVQEQLIKNATKYAEQEEFQEWKKSLGKPLIL